MHDRQEEDEPGDPAALDIAVVVVALERNQWGKLASEAHCRIIERGHKAALGVAIQDSDRRRALDGRRAP